MEEVAQLRVAFERLVGKDRRKRVARLIDPSVFHSLAGGPQENLALYRARNGEGEMRFPDPHILGSKELQERSDGLLNDVFLGERGLIGHDTADHAMQHRNKHEYQHAIDEGRPRRSNLD